MKEELYRFDGCKLLWHMERIHDHYKHGKRIYPLHIDIGATKRCNLRCIYCYGIYQKMTNEIIPRKILINLFRDAPDLGIKSLTLTGDGEPTLNPAIYDAITIGHRKGLDIGLATNGIFLNPTQMEILLQTCTWIRFNLCAVDKESYKSIHGFDRWDCVQANIKNMVYIKKTKGYKATLGLQMVLIPECVDQVIREADWAVANKLDYFVIKQFSDPGDPRMSRFNLNWYDEPFVVDILRRAEARSNERTKIIPKWGMIAGKGQRPYDHCVDCPLIFQISGNSRCYPCGYLFNNEDYCYGDLKKQSLQEILDSDKYWDIIEYMREQFDVHVQCMGCCRHDFTNAFIWEYLHPPTHLNFI